jgi:hypothetical protein
MDWSVTMKRHGWGSDQYGSEPFDPLERLVAHHRAAGKPVARVSMTVGLSEEYGALKASCTVTLECPQAESAINLAGEVAYLKAKELATDAATHLGMRTT